MTPRATRLDPRRLANLANALGVSTPLPVTAVNQPTISPSNAFLLHVVPPSYLAPPAHIHFSRGSLVPLHPTLHAQLAAIAREYALPSTAGLVLYLVDQPDGPRLSDDIWKLLWSRVASYERSPSPSALRPLACSPSPSTPSFKSDSDPPTPDSSIHTPPLLLLPGLTSPSLLPILAKVEFDIDKRKATWYDPWIKSRLNKKPNAPRQLLILNRSHLLKNIPLRLNPPPSPTILDEQQEDDDELDEDPTATFPKLTDITAESFSTKEEEVLEMLEIMSVRSKSRSSSNSLSRSSSTHSSLAQHVILPPLVTNPAKHNDRDIEQSFLAYTEPLSSPLPHPEDPLPIISNKAGQSGKREFAVFDDLELEFDHTLDIDDDDPNDRRKSQLIMRAKLDEIERTMAQLSPRILHSDLSLSPDRTSLRVSPTSPKGLDFLSPRNDDSKSFTTSSPPRLRRSDDEIEEKSWPAIPFSVIKEKDQSQSSPNSFPPPPQLALNGVSTVLPRAPTRPPPPPPLTGGIGIGSGTPMTETETRRRELQEEHGVYEVTVGESGGGVIPLSPDPFGRYPSSSPTEPPGMVPETRARSGTVTTTTKTSKSRFSADSGDEPIPTAGGLKPTSNRTTLMSVKTIKKLWRKSKEKEKNLSSGDAPPPTPVTPTFANFASSAGGSDDIDKSLPSIPPPRPSRPSEEQLDFPDISMQAVLPPRLTPSPTSRTPRPSNSGGRRTPLGQEPVPTGRRTPQEQLALPPPSRPSLDQLTAPSPPPALSHTPPPQQQQQPVSGRRTPQDQLMFRPPSRPSLDQPTAPPPPSALIHALPPQQLHNLGNGSGRRTPQDQLMFRPPSRPSLDQSTAPPPPSALIHALPPQQLHNLGNGSGRRTPQDQLMFRPPSRPSLDQPTDPPPPSALIHALPPQQLHNLGNGSGRRTPQDQLMFRPPSRPSLDQPTEPPPPSALIHALPPQQLHNLGNGSGRRTPQDQLPFRPPSRPSLDQQPSIAASNQTHPHVPPPHPSHFRHPSQQQPGMQMPMFQGRNPNNGPVTPLLAMHYPSRSTSVSQQQKFDMNRLLFDQESPYPVRLASFASGGTPGAATVTPTANVAAPASYVGGGASLGTGARASPPPPPQPQRPPSADPEKPTAMTTMRKSILKWKLANPNANPNGNFNSQGFSDTSSSSSSSSTSSSIVGGGAVPRQSFERFDRPVIAGGYARGGGGRRPSVINFGSTSSLSSSTSVSSNKGGTEVPRNPQVPAQYTMIRSASASSSSGGESKSNNHTHVHSKKIPNPQLNPKHPSISTSSPSQTNQKPSPSLSIQNPKDLQTAPSPHSLSPSRQSFDSQSPGSAVERRSNASSFDMTQFEFVSPVPVSSSAPVHGPLRA